MRTFYIIKLMDGRYVQAADQYQCWYCDEIDNAGFFATEEEAIQYGPKDQYFTIIKFYDKWAGLNLNYNTNTGNG